MIMTEHKVNGNRLVHVPSRLELAKELYASNGFDDSYELVYTMFVGVKKEVVEQVLNGTKRLYSNNEKNYIKVFFTDKELEHGQ